MIISEKTSKAERAFNSHSNIKPQAFMRQIVRASLPLGKGVVLDTFAGSGSTLAAAEFLGYESIGIEKDKKFYEDALISIPQLGSLIIKSENGKLF